MNKVNFLSKVVIAIMVIAIAFSSTTTIFAGNWTIDSFTKTYKWGNGLSSISSTAASTYKNYWQNLLPDWRNACGFSLSYSSSSDNELDVYYETSSTAYGYTVRKEYDLNYVCYTFTSKINASKSESQTYSVFRSVGNHELGHVLGLDDTSTTYEIMGLNRNRYSIVTPQSADITKVNNKYN